MEPIEFLKLSVSAQTSSNQWNNLKYEIVPSKGTVIIDCDTNKIRFKRKEVTHSSETTNHQNDNESSETSDIDEKKKKLLDRLSLILPDACSYLVKRLWHSCWAYCQVYGVIGNWKIPIEQYMLAGVLRFDSENTVETARSSTARFGISQDLVRSWPIVWFPVYFY